MAVITIMGLREKVPTPTHLTLNIKIPEVVLGLKIKQAIIVIITMATVMDQVTLVSVNEKVMECNEIN